MTKKRKRTKKKEPAKKEPERRNLCLPNDYLTTLYEWACKGHFIILRVGSRDSLQETNEDKKSILSLFRTTVISKKQRPYSFMISMEHTNDVFTASYLLPTMIFGQPEFLWEMPWQVYFHQGETERLDNADLKLYLFESFGVHFSVHFCFLCSTCIDSKLVRTPFRFLVLEYLNFNQLHSIARALNDGKESQYEKMMTEVAKFRPPVRPGFCCRA
jgi:hypothetical protein